MNRKLVKMTSENSPRVNRRSGEPSGMVNRDVC